MLLLPSPCISHSRLTPTCHSSCSGTRIDQTPQRRYATDGNLRQAAGTKASGNTLLFFRQFLTV